MSYIGLGRRKTTAAADTTGLNTGSWTNVYTHDVLGAKVPFFEVYHMSVTAVPGLPTLTVYVGMDIYSSVPLAGNSEWDPAQPLPLGPDDDVYLCWSAAATGIPPVAYLWLRYDPAVNPSEPVRGT